VVRNQEATLSSNVIFFCFACITRFSTRFSTERAKHLFAGGARPISIFSDSDAVYLKAHVVSLWFLGAFAAYQCVSGLAELFGVVRSHATRVRMTAGEE
jgi:hypothetical protein